MWTKIGIQGVEDAADDGNYRVVTLTDCPLHDDFRVTGPLRALPLGPVPHHAGTYQPGHKCRWKFGLI